MLRRIVFISCFLLPFAALAQQREEELDTPFVTTPPNVVRVMLDMAKLQPGDRLIDLGSGDGRIVIAAAREGVQGLGLEIDPNLVERARDAAGRAGVADRATFAVQDIFEADFSAADVITMYLLPDVNAHLRPKLFSSLRPGARIVSHDYDMGEWRPDQTVEVAAPDKIYDRRKTSRVHYWLVPAHIEGAWVGKAGSDDVTLRIDQRYQRASGSLAWRGREYRFTAQPIEGRKFNLRLPGQRGSTLQLTLIATGDALVGRFDDAGVERPLSLTR